MQNQHVNLYTNPMYVLLSLVIIIVYIKKAHSKGTTYVCSLTFWSTFVNITFWSTFVNKGLSWKKKYWVDEYQLKHFIWITPKKFMLAAIMSIKYILELWLCIRYRFFFLYHWITIFLHSRELKVENWTIESVEIS